MAKSEQRVLYFLKSHGPQTAKTLGERLAMTSAGARQHLLSLAQAGLVDSEQRQAGRGRPKQYWLLTGAGHARFPDRHSELTLELLNSVREVFGPQGLEKLIRQRERQSLTLYRERLAGARGLARKVALLAELRSEEGYMAEWAKDGAGYLLHENHCPICAAARECQALCRSEIALFRAALGPGVDVERLEHAVSGARRCSYRIAKTPFKRAG